MSAADAHRVQSRVGAHGFTVVEALIVLVMIGIIGATSVKLMLSQDRFYTRMDEGIAAEQSVRTAADLVGSELRMGAAFDVLAAEADSVSIRFDLLKAVVCDVSGSNTAYLFVYETARNPGLPNSFGGTAYSLPYVADYEYADGWTPTNAAASVAQAACIANGAPVGAPPGDYRTSSGWAGAGFPSGLPPRGAMVRRYGRLTYRLAPSGFGPGWALYRGAQELVGPLDPTSSFQYVLANGAVLSNVPTPHVTGNIRVIRLNAVAIDDDPRFDLQRTLTMDIPLRNTP